MPLAPQHHSTHTCRRPGLAGLSADSTTCQRLLIIAGGKAQLLSDTRVQLSVSFHAGLEKKLAFLNHLGNFFNNFALGASHRSVIYDAWMLKCELKLTTIEVELKLSKI